MKLSQDGDDARQAELAELFFDSGSLRACSPTNNFVKAAREGEQNPNKIAIYTKLGALLKRYFDIVRHTH